ncbi:MAG: DNA mismatch repair endonuclease MutL [Planctomycetota bacterium]|nr:DNA mismatch repair endonuclease MutL [Planctomycetota bacterium]
MTDQVIKVLPSRIINQIAAGEVIERPFSVVKELVENSLDAGATRITVELADGGSQLIRITDDGVGFSPADLELAFVSHATSKLAELQDLDHIASLGFRGEALASIGAISRAWIRSCQPGGEAYEVRCEGGEIEPPRPAACPPGSILEIRDLFFNTPPRRRFLRSPRAEKAKCQDLLIRLALARLDVDFTFVVDGKQALRLPAGESLKDRVGRTFGRQVAGNLLEVKHQSGTYRVEGLVCHPDLARRDSTMEILYINGRCAKDRSVMFAVRQAYKEFLMHGRFPVYFLGLWLPPEEVDVNVHPTKSEVRFVQQRFAGGVLHEAARRALQAGDIKSAGIVVGDEMPKARSGLPDLPADLFGRPEGAPPRPAQWVSGGSEHSGDQEVAETSPTTPESADVPVNPFAALRERTFLQVMNLYLVFEGDDGIVVVDQHALHERVLYERFRNKHDQRETRVQGLLVPEVIDLSASDKQWLLESKDDLAAEGFLIEDFGGLSISVTGIPAVLGRARPKDLVETFIAGVGDQRPSGREAIVERFHSMACRAAVMSGDRLVDEEIKALLQEALTLEHPHNCPHGRPTVLTFSGPQLERYFKRRV